MISNEIKILVSELAEQGLKKTEIAKRVKLSRSSIYRILRNKIKEEQNIMKLNIKTSLTKDDLIENLFKGIGIIENLMIVLPKKDKKINQLHERSNYFKFKLKERENKWKLKRKIKKYFKKKRDVRNEL